VYQTYNKKKKKRRRRRRRRRKCRCVRSLLRSAKKTTARSNTLLSLGGGRNITTTL
jgi:hypothetical protein